MEAFGVTYENPEIDPGNPPLKKNIVNENSCFHAFVGYFCTFNKTDQ